MSTLKIKFWDRDLISLLQQQGLRNRLIYIYFIADVEVY